MTVTKQTEIHCQHCGAWFPSPIVFGDEVTWDDASNELIGNRVQCPSCKKPTPCDRENMRVRFEEGGFVGDDL
jgi:DNA-directed RNA polymerase subunit RPC12/RpoP